MIKQLAIVSFTVLYLLGCMQNGARDEAKPGRIISLSPNITETIFALGAQDLLIGVSDFCNYPPQTRQKTRVGGLLNPNLERIIALQPDLLLATPASKNLAIQLSQRGIRCVLLSNIRLQDIFTTIDSIGILCGISARADSLINAIKDSLFLYRQRASNVKADAPKALFILHRDPGTTRNISVIGSQTFTNDLWHLLGGRNAFERAGLQYAQLNDESLFTINPDLIIEFKFNQQWDEEKRRRNKKEWRSLQQLKAVQRGQIYVIDGNYSLIPGPRVVRLLRDYYRIMKQYRETGKSNE